MRLESGDDETPKGREGLAAERGRRRLGFVCKDHSLNGVGNRLGDPGFARAWPLGALPTHRPGRLVREILLETSGCVGRLIRFALRDIAALCRYLQVPIQDKAVEAGAVCLLEADGRVFGATGLSKTGDRRLVERAGTGLLLTYNQDGNVCSHTHQATQMGEQEDTSVGNERCLSRLRGSGGQEDGGGE
jgi:hypothetical protein